MGWIKFKIMKTIKLLVEIEVPDNYQMDEPEWTLEDSMNSYKDVNIINVTTVKSWKRF